MNRAPDYPSDATARWLAGLAVLACVVAFTGLGLLVKLAERTQQHHQAAREHTGGP